MNADKLLDLMALIREKKYPPKLLQSYEDFKKRIADDLGIEQEDAMALLGYLFKNSYVRVDNKEGLVLNYNNSEIKKISKIGRLMSSCT